MAQPHDAAGHMASILEAEMSAGAKLALSQFYLVWDPCLWSTVAHVYDVSPTI